MSKNLIHLSGAVFTDPDSGATIDANRLYADYHRLQLEAQQLREGQPQLLRALQCLIPHVLHYAAMPHAHSDASKDAANARAVAANLAQAHKAAKVPVIDIDQLAWSNLKEAIGQCPRWVEGGKHGLTMNDILWEIHHWIRANAPLPPDPIEDALVEAIAEKIRDAGDENVLDDVLHDEFAYQASAFNNSGLTAQIRYLLANDYGEQEILEKAAVSAGPSCSR